MRSVQHVAPTNAMRSANLGIKTTTIPVLLTRTTRITVFLIRFSTLNALSNIAEIGNNITGYVKNREKHKHALTKAAKLMRFDDFLGRFNVMISFVYGPYDKQPLAPNARYRKVTALSVAFEGRKAGDGDVRLKRSHMLLGYG